MREFMLYMRNFNLKLNYTEHKTNETWILIHVHMHADVDAMQQELFLK